MSGLVQLNFFIARSVFTGLSHVGTYFHKKIIPAELGSKEVTSKLQDRVNQTSERLIAAADNEVEDHDIIPLDDSIEESECQVDMLKLRSHLSSLPQFKPPATTIKDAFARRETLNTPKKKIDKQYVKLNSTYSCKSKVSSRGKSALEVIEEPENSIEEVDVDDHHQNKDVNNQKEQVNRQKVVQVSSISHQSAEEIVINYFNPTMSTDNFFRSNVSLTKSIPEPEPSYILEESWFPILQLRRTDSVYKMETAADNEEPERLTRRYEPSDNDLSPVASKTSGVWWM